jgi:hypothetical protein
MEDGTSRPAAMEKIPLLPPSAEGLPFAKGRRKTKNPFRGMRRRRMTWESPTSTRRKDYCLYFIDMSLFSVEDALFDKLYISGDCYVAALLAMGDRGRGTMHRALRSEHIIRQAIL